MTMIDLVDAPSRLAQLAEEAEKGGEVILARDGRPVARLVPCEPEATQEPPPARTFGSMKGRVWVDDAFFEPLPEEELAAYET